MKVDLSCGGHCKMQQVCQDYSLVDQSISSKIVSPKHLTLYCSFIDIACIANGRHDISIENWLNGERNNWEIGVGLILEFRGV